MIRLRALVAGSLVALATLSCSSAVAPHGAITLRVSNGNCALVQCTAHDVLAFPANQPAMPGGNWSIDLGTMTGLSLCVTIPAADTFGLIGSLSNGVVDTVLVVWTSAMPLALGLEPPSVGHLAAVPSTSDFVPDQASGWSIRLPQDTVAQATKPCTP
ncbi:MAG TPA: hypothetical protein VJ992_07780 [Gemmatimonadales bacterium]|nr:hypothetical protein [Gemmatimonadales bacterium]